MASFFHFLGDKLSHEVAHVSLRLALVPALRFLGVGDALAFVGFRVVTAQLGELEELLLTELALIAFQGRIFRGLLDGSTGAGLGDDLRTGSRGLGGGNNGSCKESLFLDD